MLVRQAGEAGDTFSDTLYNLTISWYVAVAKLSMALAWLSCTFAREAQVLGLATAHTGTGRFSQLHKHRCSKWAVHKKLNCVTAKLCNRKYKIYNFLSVTPKYDAGCYYSYDKMFVRYVLPLLYKRIKISKEIERCNIGICLFCTINMETH